MTWSLPTLGWGVLEWAATFLPSPRDDTKPLMLTDEQAEFVLAWYAVDRNGHFLYRRSISERAKGWGKSPLHAVICVAELGASDPDLSAPVLFDGWRGKEPIGRPWGVAGMPRPWVQIAAVSEDQTDNTYSVAYELLTANDSKAADALGVDAGQTRFFLRGRPGTLEPVTASAGSREGQPITHGLLDETHLYTKSNKGIRLAATIRRNVAKMGGRTQETTNAPQLGEGSVAEHSGNAVDRGFSGILWDAKRPEVEPDPSWDDERLLGALSVAYGDSWWVDKPRILADVRDPAADWNDSLRFFFNIRTAGAGRAVDPRRWDELARPRDVAQGEYIGIGFDGSINEDETWLRGCSEDGYRFTIGRWHRPVGAPADWKVPRSEVHERLQWAFGYYHVGRMFCDPFKWWTEVEGWVAKYGKDSEDKPRVVVLDTNQETRFAPAVDRWRTSVREGLQYHDGDPAAAEHAKAAHLKKVRATAEEADGRTRFVIVKGEDRKRIDGAVADVLALHAAMTMPPPRVLASPRFIPFD